MARRLPQWDAAADNADTAMDAIDDAMDALEDARARLDMLAQGRAGKRARSARDKADAVQRALHTARDMAAGVRSACSQGADKAARFDKIRSGDNGTH